MKYVLDNVEYNVVIEVKNNKNLYIRFKDDGFIHVTCNWYYNKNSIKKILDRNKDSLRNMINHVRKEQEKSDSFFYLGKSYDIILDDSVSKAYIDGNSIFAKNLKELKKWYENETIRIFDERYVYIFNKFNENIKSPILKIRKMKTRWGVYNRSNHTITLNSRLIEFGTQEIDYVIVHELCHIIHFNHSKEFWNLVSKYCRDYKSIRKQLRE